MRYQVVKTYTAEVEAEDANQAIAKAEALFEADPSSYVTIETDDADMVEECELGPDVCCVCKDTLRSWAGEVFIGEADAKKYCADHYPAPHP